MKINFSINSNEYSSNKKLQKALADKFKVEQKMLAKDEVCVADKGFKFESKKAEDGGFHVEIVIPEWVTTEINEVLLKNIDMVISAVNTLRSGFELLGYAGKGIKKDIREVFEKHRND